METKETTLTRDQRVIAFFEKLTAKKAEVSNAERPVYVTGGQFRYSESVGTSIDIMTARDERKLVEILVFLKDRSERYPAACEELGVAAEFKWLGFTYDEWKQDLKTRVSVLQIAKRKAELKELEARVNAVMTPELRAELELKALEAEI